MSDRTLKPVSALAGLALPGRYGKPGAAPGVAIAERVGLGLATFATRKGQARALEEAIRQAYSVDLPENSTIAHGPKVSFLGYGPGQWLAISETLAGEALAEDLETRLKGLASVTDQNGGRAVIRISGPRARDVLAKGLAIDLDPRVFKPGDAATSTLSLMGVQIWQVDDTPAYDIALFRSVSESFWHWLTSSAGEFGYEVVAERS